MTDREVAEALLFDDMNAVRPRITELVQAGSLVEVGSKQDTETGRTVRLVEPKKDE